MLLEDRNAMAYEVGGAIGGAVTTPVARSGARVSLTGRTREGLDEVGSGS